MSVVRISVNWIWRLHQGLGYCPLPPFANRKKKMLLQAFCMYCNTAGFSKCVLGILIFVTYYPFCSESESHLWVMKYWSMFWDWLHYNNNCNKTLSFDSCGWLFWIWEMFTHWDESCEIVHSYDAVCFLSFWQNRSWNHFPVVHLWNTLEGKGLKIMFFL